MLQKKTEVSGKTKVAMLLCSMGPQWMKVFNRFQYTNEEDKDKLEIVKDKFDAYFVPRKLVKSYITRFQKRQQQPNEIMSPCLNIL